MSTKPLSRRTFVTGTTIAGLAAIAGRGVLALPAQAAGVAKVGEAAPAFTTAATSGQNISLGDQRGKLVVREWTNRDAATAPRPGSWRRRRVPPDCLYPWASAAPPPTLPRQIRAARSRPHQPHTRSQWKGAPSCARRLSGPRHTP